MMESVDQYILQPSLGRSLCAEDGSCYQALQLFTSQGARLHSGELSMDSSYHAPSSRASGIIKGRGGRTTTVKHCLPIQRDSCMCELMVVMEEGARAVQGQSCARPEQTQSQNGLRKDWKAVTAGVGELVFFGNKGTKAAGALGDAL